MSTIRGHQGGRKGKPVPPLEALSSDLQKQRFLTALATDRHCNEKEACKKAGIRVSDLPRLLSEDKKFREEYDEVQAQYTADLEGTAHERAMRDNTMLKWLLQNRSEKYNGGGNVGITMNVTPEQVKSMTKEELEELQRKLSKS